MLRYLSGFLVISLLLTIGIGCAFALSKIKGGE
jgi:hypothetical protein